MKEVKLRMNEQEKYEVIKENEMYWRRNYKC